MTENPNFYPADNPPLLQCDSSGYLKIIPTGYLDPPGRFEYALLAMREGRAIRRHSWEIGLTWTIEGSSITGRGGELFGQPLGPLPVRISADDVLAEDWELAK